MLHLLTPSSLSICELRLSKRATDTKESMWKLLSSSEDQWPHEWQRSPGLTAAQTGSKPLHRKKLEELCKSLGHELWWTDPAGAPDARIIVLQPHSGVLAPLQPEDGHRTHWSLPHLPAHWCAAIAAELDWERLAIAVAADALIGSMLFLLDCVDKIPFSTSLDMWYHL